MEPVTSPLLDGGDVPSSSGTISSQVANPVLHEQNLEKLTSEPDCQSSWKRPSSVTSSTGYEPTESSEGLDKTDPAGLQHALACKDRVIAAQKADIANLTQLLKKKDFEISALRRHIQVLERKVAQDGPGGKEASDEASCMSTTASTISLANLSSAEAPSITVQRASYRSNDNFAGPRLSTFSTCSSNDGSVGTSSRARRMAARDALAHRQRKALVASIAAGTATPEANAAAAAASATASSVPAHTALRQRMEDRQKRRGVTHRAEEAAGASAGLFTSLWGANASHDPDKATSESNSTLQPKTARTGSGLSSTSSRSESIISSVSSMWFGNGDTLPAVAEDKEEEEETETKSQSSGVWGILGTWTGAIAEPAAESDEETFNVWGEDDNSDKEAARKADFRTQKEKVQEQEREEEKKQRLADRKAQRKKPGRSKSPLPGASDDVNTVSSNSNSNVSNTNNLISSNSAVAVTITPSTSSSTPGSPSNASSASSTSVVGSVKKMSFSQLATLGRATTKFRPQWKRPPVIEKE